MSHFDLVVSGDGPREEQRQRVTDVVGKLGAAGATLLSKDTGRDVVLAAPARSEFYVT